MIFYRCHNNFLELMFVNFNVSNVWDYKFESVNTTDSNVIVLATIVSVFFFFLRGGIIFK